MTDQNNPPAITPDDYITAVSMYNMEHDLRLNLHEENTRLRDALKKMIYETTCLSPLEDDGSHWCNISKESLLQALKALKEQK